MQIFFDQTCAICQAEKLTFRPRKKLWGLQVPETVSCGNCGAVFHEDELRWKLMHLKDKQSPFWLKYRQKSFYVREWIQIGADAVALT